MQQSINDVEGYPLFRGVNKALQSYRNIYLINNKFNNLSKTEVEILACVANHQPNCTAKGVANFLQVSKTLVSRKVDFLRSEGYLTEETDQKDKRRHLLFLGEKSKPFTDELLTIVDNYFLMLKRGISDTELQIFFSVLKTMTRNIEAEVIRIKNDLGKGQSDE